MKTMKPITQMLSRLMVRSRATAATERLAALGVAVLDGLGIEGDGAHATHEHILVDDIPRRGALLAGLLATL